MSGRMTKSQGRFAHTANRRTAVGEGASPENGRAAKALQDSEKRYRRLFESAKDGILILDDDTGEVVDVNPFLIRLLGYSYDEFCGKRLWDIGAFKDIAASKEAFKNLQEKEYIRYKDLSLETHDGQLIDVEFVSNVYLVDDRRVIQCNIRDITTRLSLEHKLRQAQKMEAVGRLAGGVAHDFNNMLCVILGYAELGLAKVGSDHPLHTDLKEIVKAAKHSAGITQQLLAFACKQPIVPVALDLNRTVERMLEMLHRLIGEDIDLVWLPEAGLGSIKMDPVQVDEILVNLAINARDAILDVGTIVIETASAEFDEADCLRHAGFVPGNFLMLAIGDDGCGMDKESLDKIFEPFFTSKELGEGTGLGLATVYGIVEQNHGFIDVSSEPGKGTTFRIYLPRCTDRCVDSQRKLAPDIPYSRSETVLLVEDEPAILALGKRMLERLGYRVLAANTPGAALALAEEHSDEIHLLVTDVVMPEMNGRNLAERLHSICPGLKTLFMSGYTADAIAHRGVLEEGLNFVQKPFSVERLSVKVRKALEDK